GGEIIVLGCPPQQGAGAIGRRDDLCWVAGRRGAISTLKSTPEIRLTISTTSRTEKPWPAARCRRLPRAFSGMQRSKAAAALGELILNPRRLRPPRCATRHKLDTQTYKGQAGRQIATLFERPA